MTATASGTLSIEAVVNGETVSTSLTVGTASYVLEADTISLTQHKAEKVVFTLKANSQPLPNAKVIFKSNSDFIGLPTTEQTTDKNGQITVTTLTATASGTLSIEAVVNGETVSTSFSIAKANYMLTATPDALALNMATEVLFTLQANGSPLGKVEVKLSGNDFTGLPVTATTRDDGTFTATLTPTGSEGSRQITATVGTESAIVTLEVRKNLLVLTASGGGGSFDLSQTITLTAALKDATNNDIPLDSATVTWTVESSTVNSAAWNRNTGVYNGLTWGMTPLSLSAAEGDKTTPGGTAPTSVTARLTDIVGEREVTVKAEVTYDGQSYEATKSVKFGEGPLAVFQKPLHYMTWTEAVQKCGGYYPSGQTGYQPATNLPRKEELQAVSGRSGYGAAFAAGWPDDRNGSGRFRYWTGELYGSGSAKFVDLDYGNVGVVYQGNVFPVAVCRR